MTQYAAVICICAGHLYSLIPHFSQLCEQFSSKLKMDIDGSKDSCFPNWKQNSAMHFDQTSCFWHRSQGKSTAHQDPPSFSFNVYSLGQTVQQDVTLPHGP
uniref:Uncharacterized protein n=1 Tax=Eutreptiella gymnastica TaxID=73025 RepID=A0A7S4LQ85_9EUGL